MAFRLKESKIFKSFQKANHIILQKIESEKAKKLAKAGQEQLDSYLMEAAGEGDFMKINRLLNAGADIQIRDEAGRTALMLAASNGSIAACSVLLENKMDIDEKDFTGRTALMHAAMTNRIKVCELLLKNGANVNANSSSGWTPLMWAAWKGHVHACAFLVANGADIYAEDIDGKTALMNSDSNVTDAFLKSLETMGKNIGRDILASFLAGFRECIHQ
jgi:ankyrin repeat protein